MQDESEMLAIDDPGDVQSTVVPAEPASDRRASPQLASTESHESQAVTVDEAESAEYFDFSLPSQGKKHRKVKAKKIDNEAETCNLPVGGETKITPNVSALNHSDVGLKVTGKRSRVFSRKTIHSGPFSGEWGRRWIRSKKDVTAFQEGKTPGTRSSEEG